MEPRKIETALRFLETLDGTYYLLNPIRCDLSGAATDRDVLRRDNLLIDVDPEKPDTNLMATAQEKAAALALTGEIHVFLINELGWPEPLIVDSGNGCQLVFRVSLANTLQSTELVKRFLNALATRFDRAEAKVDTSVTNASRLAKLPGTIVRKGPSSLDRPHRVSRLISAPETMVVVTAEQIEAACESLEERSAIQAENKPPSQPKTGATEAPDTEDDPKDDGKPGSVKVHRGDWPEWKLSPVDDFNQRGNCKESLIKHDWKIDACLNNGEIRLTRPEKDGGTSATLGHNKGFHVFTSSKDALPFKANENYSKFEVYAMLEHNEGNGKYTKTIDDLIQKGFGTYKDNDGSIKQNPPPPDWKRADKETRGRTLEPSANGNSVYSVQEKIYSTCQLSDFGDILSDVKEEAIEWIVEQRLARSKIHLTIGPGGVGKSTYVIAKAAGFTNRTIYPGGLPFVRSGKVAVLAAEDGKADTIKPRFVAAGGDPSKIFVLKTKVVTKDEHGRTVILYAVFKDHDYWNRFFDLWAAEYLLADPVQAFLGRGVNDSRNAEVRDILEPFAELLRERGVALEAVTHTPKKIESPHAAEMAIGSVAYPNISRIVHVHWVDSGDEGHYFVTQPKNSLGPCQQILGYRIEPHEYEVDGLILATSKIIADVKAPDICEKDLMNSREGRGRGPLPMLILKLAKFLVEFMRGKGPVMLGEIAQAAGQAGLIGKQKPDGKWSMFTKLYDAVESVPKLAAPDGGWKIVTSKDDPSLVSIAGKAKWELRRENSPF